MHTFIRPTRALLIATLAALPMTAFAQGGGTPPRTRVAPSGRATTAVSITIPGTTGAKTIKIDYGQPHARGRDIVGKLIPYDTVYRLGANAATALTTDVDIVLGGTTLKAGAYTLFSRATKTGWQLVISGDTGEWGTAYKSAKDIARVPLTLTQRKEPLESFSMWLIPATDGDTPHGTLRFAWGDVELATEWSVVPAK